MGITEIEAAAFIIGGLIAAAILLRGYVGHDHPAWPTQLSLGLILVIAALILFVVGLLDVYIDHK